MYDDTGSFSLVLIAKSFILIHFDYCVLLDYIQGFYHEALMEHDIFDSIFRATFHRIEAVSSPL